jgi:hypothetical protein
MALAALVLGIVGFVLAFACGIGGVAAVLAIVFGFLGMSKAKTMGGTGKGMSIAGIVLGIVAILLSILFYLIIVVWANNASDSLKNIAGPANKSDYSVKIDDCSVDSYDSPQLTGTIRNLTGSSKSYMINFEFKTSSGSVIDTSSTYVTVPANGSIDWSGSSSKTTTTSNLKCNVTGVDNWFN